MNSKQLYQLHSNASTRSRQNEEEKKKTISETTHASRFNGKLILMIIGVTLIVSLSPSVNYGVAYSYNTGFRETIQQIQTIFTGKMYIITTQAWQYLQIKKQLEGKPYTM